MNDEMFEANGLHEERKALNDAAPIVSIIIPTRDREEPLPECLKRLLNQDGPTFEVLVIDSSSTLQTQEILSQFPEVINIRVGDIPNSMVFARNVGLSQARGKIVAYIDDDCFVHPNWLASLYQEYKDPEVVAVGGRIIYHPWSKPKVSGQVATVDLAKDVIRGQWDTLVDKAVDVPLLPGGNCSVKRSVALAVGGFDTNYIGSANLEEGDFFLRVRDYGKIKFTSEAVVEHRAVPRSDGIERSYTNFVYRYSMVRNRFYLLRKFGIPVLFRATRNQLVQLIGGTLGLLWQALIFFVASATGILAGLLCSINGKSDGLDISSHEEG